jgi:hypothetical protein
MNATDRPSELLVLDSETPVADTERIFSIDGVCCGYCHIDQRLRACYVM